MSLFNDLASRIFVRVTPRFHDYEVRSSLLQIAQRWNYILSEEEKKKVSRTLGGNRYSKTTYEMLDVLFKEIVQEHGGEPR